MPPAPDLGSGRPLLDRLGVKTGMTVLTGGFDHPDFARALRERGARLVARPPRAGADMIFMMVNEAADLHALRLRRTQIHDRGVIWVLRRKGAGRTVRETDVIEAGRAAGLVDNKIAAFSDTLAAMRLVVPLASRQAR